MELDELQKRFKELQKMKSESIERVVNINKESDRVSKIASESEEILENLDKKFEEVTELNSLDIKFLFFATALQCVRQYMLSNEKGRFVNDQKASKTMKKFVPISLLGPVPYDAFKKETFAENTGISGANHRYTTLGHDPLLGWIFGPINILTDSVTKNNLLLESYTTILVGNEYRINGKTNIISLVELAIERSTQDYKDLSIAVLKHGVHLGSDAFTKMGLPIPILNTISPELTSKFMKNGIDLYGVTRGYALSSFINSIVAAVHGLFFSADSTMTKDMYEVKTRKIIMYSNTIASVSNVVLVAMISASGNGNALNKLDIGGVIVTVNRLIHDQEFIRKVKEEFIFNEFRNMVMGESL